MPNGSYLKYQKRMRQCQRRPVLVASCKIISVGDNINVVVPEEKFTPYLKKIFV